MRKQFMIRKAILVSRHKAIKYLFSYLRPRETFNNILSNSELHLSFEMIKRRLGLPIHIYVINGDIKRWLGHGILTCVE